MNNGRPQAAPTTYLGRYYHENHSPWQRRLGDGLALLLLENGHEVTLWSYTEEESRVLRETRENPMLKGVPLPETMGLTTDMGR